MSTRPEVAAEGSDRASLSARALRSEAEITAWIIDKTRLAPEARDLAPRFTIVRRPPREGELPSWDLRAIRGWSDWSIANREAFLAAVRAAQARFDVL